MLKNEQLFDNILKHFETEKVLLKKRWAQLGKPKTQCSLGKDCTQQAKDLKR